MTIQNQTLGVPYAQMNSYLTLKWWEQWTKYKQTIYPVSQISQGVQIAFRIKIKFKILLQNCPISYLCQFWKDVFFEWWFVVLNVLNTVNCSSSPVARCNLFWLGLYHSTLTPARMPRLQWDVVMLLLSYVETTFSRDKLLESLHGSVHPPEREINPLKMAGGCPWGGIIIKRSHVQSSHPVERTC